MTKPPEEIRFDMLENGLDFVTSGIEQIVKDRNVTSTKYAILHLAAGIELILKDQITKEHWSLIFDNVNNSNFGLLKTGDFKSIDFETILQRLQNVCRIEISEKDLLVLCNLRKLRNKIEHFEFSINPQEMRSIASRVLLFLLDFIQANFDESRLSVEVKGYLEELRSLQGKFKEFARIRNAQIKKELDLSAKKYEIETCPVCRQAALVLNDERQCAFCFYTDEPEKIAELYAENILGANSFLAAKDGEYYPVSDCFHCGASDTFVEKEDDYICFSCFESNHKTEVMECGSCGQLYQKSVDDIGICDYCIDMKSKEND